MAVDEINAAGGILGKKIKLEFVDTASDPGKARAAVQRALDDKPIAILGPDLLGLGERHAEAHGRRRGAADHRRRGGAPHRAGLEVHLPHLVRPERVDAQDRQLPARRRQGQDRRRRVREQRLRQGRPRRHREGAGGARHQGRGRRLDRGRPGRLRRRRDQGQGRQRRRGLRLSQRGGKRAFPARGQEAGPQQAADRRDHAARPEGDRARRRRGQRREGPCRPDHRRADPRDPGVRQEVRGQVQAASPTTTA